MIECERRWKVKSLPSDYIEKFTIEQVYAHYKTPDVRIRKITRKNSEEFYHTVKYQLKSNEREEIEQKISKERYERIFDVINKKPVVKERILIDIGNDLVAEVDKFLYTGDIIVEVEFKTEEQSKNFVAPDWFGEEITKNKSFTYSVFVKINNIAFSTIWD